jgi:MoxR-like ATPase
LSTPDERRALELLEAVGERVEVPVHTWSVSDGIDGDRDAHPLPELLARLGGSDTEQIWALFDAAQRLSDLRLRRHVRRIAQRSNGPTIVLVDPDLPSETPLRQWIPELSQVVLPPPSRDELEAAFDEAAHALEESGYPGARARFDESMDMLVAAAIGLERSQLDRLLAEAVLEHGLDIEAVRRFIAHHKPAVLDRGGLLTEVTAASEEELGGLAQYKHWLSRRRLALSPRAFEAGIVPPRGVLLLGVQGCGKSLAARTSASLLGLPLLRLDVGALFGGTVGQSEANLRRATAALERIAPVVVWLDEIDKGLAGSEGSASDAGTSSRVLGGLLTWLAERTRPVFVVATANRVDRLPPELLRRGRLDEVFFIDLPNSEERQQILRVHLEMIPAARLGQVPPMADPWPAFADLARRAEGFSGAELEGALTEARLDALAENRELCASDLERAIEATVPLSVSRAEEVDALRQWAQQRARPASS